jgi:integrating conjugative element protein (TIGR03757 family)
MMIWKVSKKSFRVQFVWLVTLVLFAEATFADQRELNPPHVIEVFTSAQYPVIETNATGSGSHLQGPVITLYEIDGIQSVERDLSLNLPVEPQQSKQVALQRIQNLDEQTRSRMHASATALAKAMQYGVDRYPAVVFDGEAVVYGVTDLTLAIEQYRAWRTGKRP